MTAQPIDRVHFLEEQSRNRRRSLRFSVFAVVGVALAGIPLCVIVAPLLFGPLLFVAHAIDLVLPLPESVWSWMRDVVFALPDIWARLRGRPVDIAWGTLALVYVVPGSVLMVLSWPVVAVLSRRAGAATMLQRLSSRDIDTVVPAERQLANIVEEIAIAAGVRPPQVRIIESAAVNAVAVGLTSDDAVILATTGFLERLDRDERQAVIAHLVGSVGNGDLEIGAVILSVFATWGLVALLLETPFNKKRWAVLGRFLRLGVDAVRGRVDAEQSHVMMDVLLGGAAYNMDAMIDGIMETEPRSVLHGCVIMVFHVPMLAILGLASITAKMSIALFTNLGLGPWLAAMWRARRRLADASAVQLTRNPTALARAVQTLDKSDVEVPGGWVAYFLFPVWPAISEENAEHSETASFIVGMRLEADARLERIAALGAALESPMVRPSLRVRLARLGTWKDIRMAVGMGIVALLMAAALILITLAAASLVLMLFWQVLRWLNPRR